jgi:hypothetical protein
MNRSFGMLALLVGLASAYLGTEAKAQAPANPMTVRGVKDPVQTGAPAGQSLVYADGTYTLGMGEVATKVEVVWYKQGAGGVLTPVGTWSDPNPAGGTFKTNTSGVDKKTATNTDQLYTGIATLYKKVNGGNEVAGSVSAFTNFNPN